MRDLRLTVEGGVATIAIDRPQARNALATQTMRELDEALAAIGDKDVKVLVVRGAGDRAFCAGGDLKELEHMRSEAKAAEMASAMRATLDRLPQLSIPVIAALNGDAFGGGAELAVACDFRVAAAHARIGFTQVTLGLMPSIAAAPAAALAGIKASVNAVRPHRNPELAAGTVEAFARTWADPAHWEAVRKMERQRQTNT